MSWIRVIPTAQSESILLSTSEEEQPEEDLANNHNQNQRPLATVPPEDLGLR